MTREQYDELSAPLVRVLLDMEDDILREIAAQLSRDGDISDTSKWRIRQLARAGRFDKRAAAIIAGYSEVEDGQAMDAVIAAAETEIGYLDNAVQAANAAGLSEYFSDIPAEESALGAAKAFQRQAASDLNLVNTVMGYKAKSAYVNAVNAIYRDTAEGRQGALDIMGKGAAKAVSGQMSLQEATRKTIRELAQKGIPAFVDKRGREWSPEAYVMMDMRSTLGNTARAAQDARCDEYGINLIELSSHLGARPKCAIDQGKIYSRDGTSGVTTDGAGNKIHFTPFSQTSYGQPDGILGINCGHVQYPFAEGINFQRYFPYPKEENDRRYMQFQQQRAMERGIRAAKRECMMLQETGDTEGLQKASLRLRNQREKYRAYCKETGLKQHNDRTQVYGYDRRRSSKAVWAERKAKSGLDNGSRSGIINNAKTFNIFNDHDVPSNAPITTQHIVDELTSTNIGRQTLKYIENLPEQIKLTYTAKGDNIRGEQIGDEITVFLGNCKNTKWAARTVIHEVTHHKYGIGQSQWAECVCVAQELKHARNRDYLTTSELRTIISAVKEAYPEYNWRKGGVINGRKKSH
ncbi:MAG: phage minor capsid protein [Ruminococcus sp.]|nr:MAG: phage minor capsid protein [Ruminococcus sp.]